MLKLWVPGTDPASMSANEMACPVCDGNVPLHGDEQPGDEVFCGFCGVMSTVAKSGDDEDCELEPDW